MKLLELVTDFRSGRTFEDFCHKCGIDTESEGIEIYAQTPVTLESQLGIFPFEETKGKAEYISKGLSYETLFDFYYFMDFIKASKEMALSDGELAQILFNYAVNDA